MPSETYKRYALGTLTIVYTLSFLDSNLIVLLLQPIKEDLKLTDSQLGLLTGIASALFYTTLGVPIARWADRGNRVTIASLATGLWGATVMACWFVQSFGQLLCARVAATIGQAGCAPPTYSLVGDYYPAPGERSRAMAIYMLASPLSSIISFGLGGWLNDRVGWRGALFLMGAPGLLVAAATKLTLVEPRRPASGEILRQHAPPMMQTLLGLWQQRSTRHLGLAIVLLFTMGNGLAVWYGAFLIRAHGLATSELGLWFGLIFGVGGAVGILLGGYAARRWFTDNERGQMRFTAIAISCAVAFLVLFLLARGKYQALAALVPVIVTSSIFYGPAFALMQRLVLDEVRATAMAVVLLFANLIGLGVGPQVVGLLSDLWAPRLGNEALRYAMLCTSFLAFWAAYHFWQVGRTVESDLLAINSVRFQKAGASHRLQSS